MVANTYPAQLNWAFEWVDAIGKLYHLNTLRLQAPADSPERVQTQKSLELAVQCMADRRDKMLADPVLADPKLIDLRLKILTRMKNHWKRLDRICAMPLCPWTTIPLKRDMRGPVIGRKSFYGSGALWSGILAATMYSLFATLNLYGINPRIWIWLTAYLQACANNGAKAPADLSAFALPVRERFLAGRKASSRRTHNTPGAI